MGISKENIQTKNETFRGLYINGKVQSKAVYVKKENNKPYDIDKEKRTKIEINPQNPSKQV